MQHNSHKLGLCCHRALYALAWHILQSRMCSKCGSAMRSSMFHVASFCQHLVSNPYPTAELWDQASESIRGRVSAPREKGCLAGKMLRTKFKIKTMPRHCLGYCAVQCSMFKKNLLEIRIWKDCRSSWIMFICIFRTVFLNAKPQLQPNVLVCHLTSWRMFLDRA